jgi:transcriptional regulator with XRE-family HTH domain
MSADGIDGLWIRDFRKRLGLSQAEFGAEVGVSRQAVGLWEDGGEMSPENRAAVWAFYERESRPAFSSVARRRATELLETIRAAEAELRGLLGPAGDVHASPPPPEEIHRDADAIIAATQGKRRKAGPTRRGG